MTPDGFLTFLALLVAVYAVASPLTRLRLRLVGGWFWTIVSPITLLLTLYFQFFDAFKQPCPPMLGAACSSLMLRADSSFTPQDIAFLIVLGWMLSALLIHGTSKPGPSSLPTLSRLVDELLVEARYAELLKLVEPHLSLIDRAARRKLRLQRLHDWLAGLRGIGSVEYFIRKLDEAGTDGKSRMPTAVRHAVGRLHVFVPPQRNLEQRAQDILRSIYRADEARRFMVKQRPYAGISLLRLESYERFGFSDRFFGDLIADPGSALYLEIRDQQETRYQSQVFPERVRLLHFLFSHAENANALAVWKPVGEDLLRRLDPAVDADYVVHLNGPATHFEQERWSDPVYVGIQFFRLMVDSAAHQGIEWHMWLYYLPLILERLEETYDTSDPLIDETDEFPTRAARLIYEIISALGDFVRLAPDLPEGSPHRRVPGRFENDNANIPVSAAISLGRCVKTVAMSDRLDDRFAAYMHECVLRDISELPQDENAPGLRGFLVQSMVEGGNTFAAQANNQAYGQRLATLIADADHVHWDNARDYIAAIDAAYPDCLPEHIRP